MFPSLCIVLLEDIDAVGLQRRSKRDADDDNSDSEENQSSEFNHYGLSRRGCTLSGLLNVLDGVASQEGRIVLMTSNFADKLDEELVRPGRIDQQIFLGYISPKTALQMFIGMFAPVPTDAPQNADLELGDERIRELALEFSRNIPENTFSPAKIQGYLLHYRDSAADTAANISRWTEEEKTKAQEAKARAEDPRKRNVEKKNKQQRKACRKRSSVSSEMQEAEGPEECTQLD